MPAKRELVGVLFPLVVAVFVFIRFLSLVEGENVSPKTSG